MAPYCKTDFIQQSSTSIPARKTFPKKITAKRTNIEISLNILLITEGDKTKHFEPAIRQAAYTK